MRCCEFTFFDFQEQERKLLAAESCGRDE
jgi:hypothetical protein